MIGLEYPAWLLLGLPVAVALWRWPLPSRLLNVMRAMALGLVLLAVAGLSVRLPSRAGTVVVVVDRSQSMPGPSDAQAVEIIQSVQRAKGAGDRLAVIGFGRSSVVEQAPGGEAFGAFTAGVGNDASNYDAALDRAMSLIDPQSPGRILIVGDGRWTGADPTAQAARAMARQIAIDYRLLERATTRDLAIAKIDAPDTVAPGEGYTLGAWINAPVKQEIAYELVRGNTIIGRGTRSVDAGMNRLVFRDRAERPGVHRYQLRIIGQEDDPVPENNQARLLVGIEGQKPVLHVAPGADSQLARLLREGGIDVEVAGPGEAGDWSLEALAGYSAVLIENVSWQRLGEAGMANIAAWVKQTGGGVMMTGGQQSYGPGGYFNSALEEVLPVSMELRREHRKLALSIVITMDRSGSMMAPVDGGRTKMDLANAGASEVVGLLTAMDEIGVWAVDSAAHKIVDLQNVTDAGPIVRKIRSIESMGGGIFVYESLKHAVSMISQAKNGTRHIILFSDAADSEEPGDYVRLVETAAKAGITISVIGLGTPGDVDAALLKDIAKRGNGRVFFTNDAKELPRLFAQDTFVVARNSFIDELTSVNLTGGLTAVTGQSFVGEQQVGGYNLTYLRPRANLAGVTGDEYSAPLIASWQVGAGRAVSYTGEADGKFAGPIARWEKAGALYSSLVRWTSGEDRTLAGGAVVTQSQSEGEVKVRLHLDPEREGDGFERTPRLRVLRGVAGQEPEAQSPQEMRWEDADTLVGTFELRGNETAIGAVEVGEQTRALAPVVLAYSPEFAPAGAERGRATLSAMARATMGQARDTLEGIWEDLPRKARLIELSPWLLFMAVVVFVLEVFERRSGLLSVRRRGAMKERKAELEASQKVEDEKVARGAQRVGSAQSARSAKPQAAEKKSVAAEKKQVVQAGGMAEALKAAQQRARGRTGGGS